jgi:hypothetical protein
MMAMNLMNPLGNCNDVAGACSDNAKCKRVEIECNYATGLGATGIVAKMTGITGSAPTRRSLAVRQLASLGIQLGFAFEVTFPAGAATADIQAAEAKAQDSADTNMDTFAQAVAVTAVDQVKEFKSRAAAGTITMTNAPAGMTVDALKASIATGLGVTGTLDLTKITTAMLNMNITAPANVVSKGGNSVNPAAPAPAATSSAVAAGMGALAVVVMVM